MNEWILCDEILLIMPCIFCMISWQVNATTHWIYQRRMSTLHQLKVLMHNPSQSSAFLRSHLMRHCALSTTIKISLGLTLRWHCHHTVSIVGLDGGVWGGGGICLCTFGIHIVQNWDLRIWCYWKWTAELNHLWYPCISAFWGCTCHFKIQCQENVRGQYKVCSCPRIFKFRWHCRKSHFW